MILLTKAILKKVPALRAQDGKGMNAIAYAKFFNPVGDGTWYMTEYDPETGEAFGLCMMHGESELGYFSIPELASIRLRFGLGIERDRSFDPIPLKECKNPCLV